MNRSRKDVMAMAREIGATVELLTSGIDRRTGNKIEIIAPDGMTFGEQSSLLCDSWDDAFAQLRYASIDPA